MRFNKYSRQILRQLFHHENDCMPVRDLEKYCSCSEPLDRALSSLIKAGYISCDSAIVGDPDSTYYVTDAGYTAWESYCVSGLRFWVSFAVSAAIGFIGLVLSLVNLFL